MTETIRDRALRKIASYLVTEGADPSSASTLALGVERILDALGVRLPMRPPIEDPNAVALATLRPEQGNTAAGVAAARAALQPFGGIDRRAEHEPAVHLPEPPEEPECPSP